MKRSRVVLLLVPLAIVGPLAYFASKRPRVLSSRAPDVLAVVGITNAVLRPTAQPTTGFWKNTRPEGYQAVAFAPDGSLVAARGVNFLYASGGASGGCRFEVWNTATEHAKVFAPYHWGRGDHDLGYPVRELMLSPNGTRWLGGDGFGHALALLDTGSRGIAHLSPPVPPDKTGFNGILPLGFSSDGSRAFGLEWTAPRRLFTAPDAKSAARVPIAGAIIAVRASDGKLLARRAIDLSGNWPLRGRVMANNLVALVTKLSYGNGGFGGGRLQLFDVRSGARQVSIERNMNSEVNGLAVAPDGTRVAFIARRTSGDYAYVVQVYNARTRRMNSVAKGAGTLAFAPNGKLAFEGEDGLTAFDFQSGTSQRLGHDARIRDFAFSPRCDLLASVSGDEQIKLWPIG